jgi:hypothetical protein
MTTGKMFFITASGLDKPMEEIPTEDFAVAKAEPRSKGRCGVVESKWGRKEGN